MTNPLKVTSRQFKKYKQNLNGGQADPKKPPSKAKRKSELMTRHLLEIERAIGGRITPAELRSALFQASRDVYVAAMLKAKQ
ncbi:MAG: hypothetical protein EHM33_01080 [Chloroflexi bacterium]|nr:MAG: hypothetical protein EHM33_01080 [Chloroflexota bacterium]